MQNIIKKFSLVRQKAALFSKSIKWENVINTKTSRRQRVKSEWLTICLYTTTYASHLLVLTIFLFLIFQTESVSSYDFFSELIYRFFFVVKESVGSEKIFQLIELINNVKFGLIYEGTKTFRRKNVKISIFCFQNYNQVLD
jgi:hypothetical protein